MTTLLSDEEYKSTMLGKMVDITQIAESSVDIWPYVQKLTEDNTVKKYTYDNNLVEKVYRNSVNTFDHVLLPTPDKNIFIVIIVDLANKKIKGHFHLDLNAKYEST